MGITVSSEYKDNGKLVIKDADAQAKFDASFDKYADEIQQLFTDTDKGLSAKLTAAIETGVSTSRTKGYGSLVRLAGIANTVSGTENSITTKIAAYQKLISTLKTRYSDEMDRYWSKFTQLETMMSKYNSYSSLFTSST